MLGKRVQDTITGFEGVVTGRCQYISGCNQSLVQPVAKEDGTFVESRWFDEQRLRVLPGDPIVLKNEATPGFDAPAPIR